MASWDSPPDAEVKKIGLRCLACGRRLDEALAVVGSLRCLDCRDSNAALKSQLVPPSAAAEQSESRNQLRPSPPS